MIFHFWILAADAAKKEEQNKMLTKTSTPVAIKTATFLMDLHRKKSSISW